jgi:hypothetical protein
METRALELELLGHCPERRGCILTSNIQRHIVTAFGEWKDEVACRFSSEGFLLADFPNQNELSPEPESVRTRVARGMERHRCGCP